MPTVTLKVAQANSTRWISFSGAATTQCGGERGRVFAASATSASNLAVLARFARRLDEFCHRGAVSGMRRRQLIRVGALARSLVGNDPHDLIAFQIQQTFYLGMREARRDGDSRRASGSHRTNGHSTRGAETVTVVPTVAFGWMPANST